MSAIMWLVVLFVSSLVPGAAQQAPSDDASHRAKLLEQAEHGDAKAQFELCQDNAYGFNGAKDVQQAIRWCRKAIESGNTAARSILGQIYFDGNGVTRDFAEAAKWFGCPQPSTKILSTCQETSQDSLPPGALHFLAQLKCDDTSAWDGSEVDLAGEGTPAYLVCCREAPHGPCGAVLIAKVGGKWSDLTAKEGLLGFTGACNGFIVLESEHNGFHDVCIPDQCSTRVQGTKCIPTIWQFSNGRYRSVTPESLQP